MTWDRTRVPCIVRRILYHWTTREVPDLFFFLTSLLEYNCFKMLRSFLLYNQVNQLYAYIYPPIPSLSQKKKKEGKKENKSEE